MDFDLPNPTLQQQSPLGLTPQQLRAFRLFLSLGLDPLLRYLGYFQDKAVKPNEGPPYLPSSSFSWAMYEIVNSSGVRFVIYFEFFEYEITNLPLNTAILSIKLIYSQPSTHLSRSRHCDQPRDPKTLSASPTHCFP